MLDNIIGQCRIIFGKDADSLEEISIFAEGNPHPLRIYVEGQISQINDDLLRVSRIPGGEVMRHQLVDKRDQLKELDKMIMEYIETIY